MSSETPPKKTLLQKYEIPLEFLDFGYIRKCDEAKMLERIVKILRSGEEGYYPDLQKCAEEKLRNVKPESKMLRVEDPALKVEYLEDGKREQINEDLKTWISDMKIQDELVKNIRPIEKPELPIRKLKKVGDCDESNKLAVSRIKSTDYDKWDKFDAEAAVLKIDLDEERQREIVEMKNKKNSEKQLIEEIQDDEVDCLNEFERDRLSLNFKEKGNECFKSKDYEEALKEYTQSLRFKKTAASFNNRALVYLKLKNFKKAISDANECLKMEPDNIKALIRKAQAFQEEKMFSEAYESFEKVLVIDAANQIARNEISELAKKIPPRNSFRMKIEEIEDVKRAPPRKIVNKSEKLELPENTHVPEVVRNIVVDEPTPFDKLAPKGEKSREKLVMPNQVELKKKTVLIEEIQ